MSRATAEGAECEVQNTRAFEAFIGQHPAALRMVTWHAPSKAPPAHGGHLEIETKHGQVAVIDHRSGVVYRSPPRPAAAQHGDVRCSRDLTATVPGAFDGRPWITAITPRYDEAGTLKAWRFELNTGRSFEFHMHPSHPVVSTDP